MPTPEERLASIEATCKATHKAHDAAHVVFEKTINDNFETINESLRLGHEEFKRMRAEVADSNHMLQLHCSNGGHHCDPEDKSTSKDVVIRITNIGKIVGVITVILAAIVTLIQQL